MTENPAEDKGLQKYLSDIAKLPVLSEKEEISLLKKVKSGDEEAMKKIVESNLKFVVKVASKFQNKGLSLSELISEGNLGLIKAIDKFDLSKNTKLITYAVWWIRQAIRSAIYEKNRLIRIPAKTVSTMFRIEDARQKLHAVEGEYADIEQIAQKVGVNEKRAEELLNKNLNTVSLDEVYDDNDILSRKDVQKVSSQKIDLEDDDPQKIFKRKKILEKIEKVIEKLSKRDAHIINEYLGLNEMQEEKNFAQIAREINLSRERIRQIVNEIIEKLKNEIESEGDIDYLLRM
ncbi:MAG: RNA polymerase sigma factor RpoD/SigA [Candidatus Cloacimonetes bacterium]|nr:RNA polymerase sigma factor RpoD/SigA [Candidatus Cloacimonadota bacterium]